MTLTPSVALCIRVPRFVALLLGGVTLASLLPPLRAAAPPEPPVAGVLIERTNLPDANPSAFAIGFSNGMSLCYDPVRGGLNYVWDGGFIDVGPVRPGPGKNLAPVTLLGPVVYHEQGAAPLRVGTPGRSPELRFLGYDLGEDRIEFFYTIDGVAVREEILPRPEGDGLSRRFRVEDAPGPLWYRPGSREGGRLEVRKGVPEADGFRLEGEAARAFTVEILFRRSRS